MNAWPPKPFGELTENFDSVRAPVKESERRPGPYPYYGASGVVDRVDGYIFDGDYLLVAEDGENLKTRQTPIAFMATGKFWVNNHAHIVRANDENITRYLMYAMRCADIASYLTGSTMPKLTQANMNRVPVVAPPRSTQVTIAQILCSLDDRIELNRRANHTLETIARALFKSWFVDFDPVRAKAEGRAPSGMDAETAKLFPREFVESQVGPIPKGWTVEALDTIADFRNGLALQKFRPAEGEPRLPVVKIAQLRTGQADSGEWARSDIVSDCILEDGDVVFSWSGSLTVVVWCGGRAALNQHLFRVTSSSLPKWFYLQWLLWHLPEFQRIAGDKATTMGHIQRHHLTAAKCVVPPSPLLQVVSRVFAPMLDKSIQLDLGNRTLARTRDELLPRLLSGEVNVGGMLRGSR